MLQISEKFTLMIEKGYRRYYSEFSVTDSRDKKC